MEFVPIQVGQVPERASWAEGMTIRLPAKLFHAPGWERDSKGHLKVSTDVQIPIELATELRFLASYTEKRPLSSRLPFSYQNIMPGVRDIVANTLGRLKKQSMNEWAAFPGFPLDLTTDFFADLSVEKSHVWRTGPTPVVLTHDLDSLEGLQNAVQIFAPIEETAGARSVNFVVPCGWEMDHGLLTELKEHGHEIGIHGYDHSNRTPYVSSQERKQRLEAAQDLSTRYDAQGYRAPSLCRTRELLKDLTKFYRYDSSIPTSGGLFPVPNNGCASARPFWAEGVAELPLSMPRDGSLKFLGCSPDEVLKIWIRSAREISSAGGVVVLLTHCERRFSGGDAMLRAYREFLAFISSDSGFKWSTPAEILGQTLWMKNV